MNLCTGKGEASHEEVCYEGRACPMCELLRILAHNRDSYSKAISEAEQRIAELEDDNARLSEPVIAAVEAVNKEMKEIQQNEQSRSQ